MLSSPYFSQIQARRSFLKRKVMPAREASPTTAKIILEMIARSAPKIQVTRLKLKKPMSPQLIPPIIINIRINVFK